MSKPNPQIKKFASVTVKRDKVQPFGAHFTTRLQGVNNKLVCALSLPPLQEEPPPGGCSGTCIDDPIPVCY